MRQPLQKLFLEDAKFNMGTGIKTATTKSAKTIAQQIARQMVREPLEVLKASKNQVLGTPEIANSERPKPQAENPNTMAPQEHKDREQKVKQKDSSMLSALQNEVAEIRKHKLVSSLQERIQAGEEIPLTDFPELSDNERQMLASQMASVRAHKQMEVQETVAPPTSKRSRRFGMGKGQKATAEKQQTRVEKPIPPSG